MELKKKIKKTKMNYKSLLKTERFPTVWCPGCGIGLALRETAKVFAELKMNKSNTCVVSGIGCAGRTAGYFKLDSAHGCHGRAIPLAEGIKLGNKKLNIVVVSGDGDLVGIGGNHLIHASRRNTDLTVICLNNEIYGMTGGQLSPTTPEKTQTLTSPFGAECPPTNIQGLLLANKKIFYARTSVYHVEHLHKCIKQAIQHKGFSFVEILSPCITNSGRRLGFKNPFEMFMKFKKELKLVTDKDKLEYKELGIIIR